MGRRLLSTLAAWLLAAPAGAQFVAEQITVENAPERLFGGTDADGGIDDWYLSNGVIEAIIDDVALQSDLPTGVTPPPKQSEAGATGGTLIDLALVGADNDQLNHLFSVGGLSAGNFVLHDTISASSSASAAKVTVSGMLPGFPSDLAVTTEYIASGSDRFLTLRSTVTNVGTGNANIGGFLDVFPWTTRAIVPFSPAPGLGFRHGVLDLANPLQALEFPIYSAGPGNVTPADGVMDTQSGGGSGEVSYGLLGMETRRDPDGPGGAPPSVAPVDFLFGVSSTQATALGNLPVSGGLQPGGVLIYERRIYVGDRNDVASVADDMLQELAPRLGFDTGTLSGDVDARDTANLRASAIVTRTGGPPIPVFPDGTPVTHFRTDASGSFAGVVAPVGSYEIEFRAEERQTLVVSDVTVSAGQDTRVPIPLLGGRATLDLDVRAPGPRPRVPAKVTIKGREGTPDPELAKDFEALSFATGEPDEDLEAESFGSALAQANWVQLPHGSGSVQLRPGSYEVFASRGPEYSIDRRRVTLEEGERRRLSLRVHHLVETPDALSADFHIHSARSLDSSAGPEGRVASFAAEGVEVMVSTDHDFVLDYGPVIDALGLRSRITSRVGNEVTTVVPNPPIFPNAVGHVNAWPLAPDPEARKDGAIEDEYVAPNFLFSRLRRAGAGVIQYNHPRAGVRGLTTIGIFNNIGCNRCENDVERTCSVDADCPVTPEPRSCTCVGYRPDRPLTEVPNDILLDDDVTGNSGVANPDGLRNIDFDVIEVGNGLGVAGYLETRRDWFSLLNQAWALTPRGRVPFIAGSGVSDSHRNTLESPGYFRTYVLGVGDDPAELDGRSFDESVLGGRMVATTGPWVELAIRDRKGARVGVGQTLEPSSSRVTLHVRVLASNWVPVEEVRIIANGQRLASFDAQSTPAVQSGPATPWTRSRDRLLRFETALDLDLEQDAWILVEAGAKLDPTPVPDPFVDQLVPGWVSLAFTNPIFVDLDGDGFDAPGVGTAAAGAQPSEPETAPVPSSANASEGRRARELREHFPIRHLRIPEQAVQEARERLAR